LQIAKYDIRRQGGEVILGELARGLRIEYPGAVYQKYLHAPL
jgi:hypothetical protein